MKKKNFIEEGFLPLDKLSEEEVVLVTGGSNPTENEQEDLNLLCTCDNLGCDCICL